jgi:regulator of sirC expression with transglutaminase-like and TPR domain
VDLRSQVYGNMCSIFIQEKKWDRCAKFAQDVLKQDPANLKAMYRLGLAKLNLGDLISAREYVNKVLEKEPQNSNVSQYRTNL